MASEILAKFEDRFIPEPNSGCWLWLGYADKDGYGKFQFNHRCEKAHRWAWELYHGQTLTKLCVLHRCDNPGCVNPDHLFLGTVADNIRDMDMKKRRSKHWGDMCSIAKLTREQVAIIRQTPFIPGIELAERFGVSDSHICGIRKGRFWKGKP